MEVLVLNSEAKKQTILGYVFLIPSLAVFAVFMFYPLFYTFYLSFFEWNMVKPVKKFVGLANYISVFKDPNNWKIFGNTMIYIVILLAFNFVMPYILSFILSCVNKKGKGFYKAVFFLPSVISLVVGSILYTWISTWKSFGYNFINILAGVSGVSQEVIEAARLDNVPMWKIFLDIIVPMSSATGIYVFITTIVQGLQYVFTPIKVITQGGPNYASSNLIYASYHEAFTLYRTGTSSAVSIITMAFFILLLFLEFRFVEKGVYYEN